MSNPSLSNGVECLPYSDYFCMDLAIVKRTENSGCRKKAIRWVETIDGPILPGGVWLNAMKQGINHRNQHQRDQGGAGQAAHHGPGQRGLGVGTLADA